MNQDIETANPSRGGDAKSWICQTDAYSLTDRQTAELFCSVVFIKEVFRQNKSINAALKVSYQILSMRR